MNDTRVQLVLRYAAAAASIGVAIWLRELLEPVIGDSVPFLTFFAAVVLSAWYGGFGPAVLATLLGALAALHYFVPPADSLVPGESATWASLLMYLFVGFTTALFCLSRRMALVRIARQEDVMRQESLRFNVTLTNIGDGVIMVGPDARIAFMNSAAERITGWELASAHGRPVTEVYRTIHDRTRAPADNPVTKVLEIKGAVALPHFPLLIDKQCRELPVDDHAVPIFDDDGEMRGALLVFRDDTHRRKARKALRASETRFRTLADSAPVLIWMTGADAKCSFVNQPWLDFTGNSLREEIGDGWLQGVYPDDRQAAQGLFLTAFQARQAFDVEYRLRRADGEFRWILNHGIPLYGEEGQFTGYIGSCIDITRQREAADALRESEERFRALADNAPAAIFIKDLEGRYVLANPLACQALGRPNDVVGRTDREMLPADLAARLEEHDRDVIAHGDPLENEEAITDGITQRMFLSVKFPLHNAQGERVGVCGVGFDITDRKAAEEALRESEEKFRLMSDSIPQLAWMARPDGHIFWYNQRWYDYTGTTLEEMDGAGWKSVIAPEHLPRVVASFDASLASGEPWEDTFPLRRHDGATRWHLSRALPLRNEEGEIVRWFGTNTDITERTQLEQSLRFLANASESLASLVDYKRTMQKVAELAVPAFADWCKVDVMEGHKFQRCAVTHADPAKQAIVNQLAHCRPPSADDPFGIGTVLKDRKPLLIEDITPEVAAQMIRDDDHGKILRQLGPVSLISVPFTVNGQARGVISFFMAESGRRYGSGDLALAEDLAHRAGIAIENARLYQELREADRRKDEFLAMLAHELRNPLAPIRSGLDLLAIRSQDEIGVVRSMQKQVEHLVRLVDDLLDVSRIMRGKVELRRKKVMLKPLVEQAVDTTRLMVREKRHRLTVSLAEEALWLDADPVRIVQIIENLITNACKYTDPGGEIEVNSKVDGAQAVLTIRDNGIGIEPELLPKVFDLFSQSSRSLDRSQGGLGIGLTLVRTLVQMHGGKVSVASSSTGQGSEFEVRLPTCEPGKIEVEQQPQVNLPRRVLVIDDNRAAADMLQMLLSQLEDHRVEKLYGGEKVIDTIAEFQPDIVLLDIGLPGKNGYEIAREIRAQAAFDWVLLVALTGYGQDEDRERSREAGFDIHMVKPPSIAEIRKLFQHAKLTADAQPRPPAPDRPPPVPLAGDSRAVATQLAREFSDHERDAGGASAGVRELLHDLGNTVQIVTMAAKILEHSSDPSDTEAVQRMLDNARHAMLQNLQAFRDQFNNHISP